MASIGNPQPALCAIEGEPDASGVFVVRLAGEIDISNAGTLGTTLDAMIAEAAGHIVVDLSGLEFMDSSGIAMLLRAAGGAASVEVRNPSRVVQRIIECTGLTDILRLES
jgi:anti-sigma B factor antagonist